MKNNRVIKNLSLSMFAQVISLGVSFLLNMIVPKFITELDFANWQAFVLYISFVGVLHFGLLDGIILKYSKYNYDTLDKGRLKSQFFVLTLMLTISSVLSFAIGFLFFEGFYRTVMILLAFGILSKNIFTFQSYLFQITNRIGKYAIIVIAQRLAYGVVVVLLLLFKVNNYIWYCIADLIGDTIGLSSALSLTSISSVINLLRLRKRLKKLVIILDSALC